jgi:hypothetical protein
MPPISFLFLEVGGQGDILILGRGDKNKEEKIHRII